ncbi:MAG: hypothetical protein MJY98_01495 [Fibrobacter sp.]|nr:hypothetical protein [Fibrobacter sp.]
MHVLKNKIVLAFVACALVLFAGCAGSTSTLNESAAVKDAKAQGREIDKLAMLDTMYHRFLYATQVETPADTLYDMLTDPSEEWLNELERHAQSYTEAELDTCQFYEIYAILLYRLYEREHLWEVPEDRMLWLFLSKAGMFQRFTSLKLGPMKVKNDRGSVGLASSPEVPIMLFEWDDNDWKLDLVETVPLITKGVEATAVKKSWTNKKLALYWLDKEYHLQYSRLDESLFEPVGF